MFLGFPFDWLYWFLDGFLWLCRGKTAYQTKVPPHLSLQMQAIRVKGETNVFRCGYVPEEEGMYYEQYPHKDVYTLYDVFCRSVKVNPTKDCLGERKDDGPYEFEDYATIHRKARAFGSALVGKLGVKAANNSNLGIYSKNCAGWFISALGAISQSLATVPLYDTLGADTAEFIINQCDIQVVVVDNADKTSKLVEIARRMPTLKHIVVIMEDEATEELVERGRKAGITVHRFSSVLAEGERRPMPETRPQEEDVYTSGTTGMPKGVMLTHRNILMSCIVAFQYTCEIFAPGYFGKDEVLLSFLPLSHVMEQGCHWLIMHFGGSIGYFRGNILKLGEDMQALRPTLFPVVPRLLNRMYDGVMAKVNAASIVARALFKLACWMKLADFNKGYIQHDSIWDRIVFGKIRAAVGGRVKLIMTGSAPIAPEVMQTMRMSLGCALAELYGLTECSAVGFVTWPADPRAGHCGGPAACTSIKLEDVPEMGYFAADGKGEVLLKGPAVTKGYYKEPQKTAELFDATGYMRTGDIGWLLPDGTLRIIDRKKHIFKLAQGEYVAPEKIEALYTRVDSVQQVYVDGDSLERWLIAVVVPDPDVIGAWDEKQQKGEKRSMEAICDDPETTDYILAQLAACGKANRLNSLEMVKKVILEPVPFTIDNGLLTPTLKSKRPALRMKYKEAMARIYKSNRHL
ncbi:hypothetical protein PRIPAC_93183 [Pristionchus pacificus]|uniref:Arachidonate--CoA ligase n=1 Tax=Pristionchus pacificus TaxID=54126 RepID=A0A2A6CIC2_PRIPA|nr:hypothetical protein PRIPAC_93183 [Pristionchus pacificus]|eukprot:PDM77889.1 AMP-binding protein [Pristionchus pacificus]